MLQIVVLLSYDYRGIIYYNNMFIAPATGWTILYFCETIYFSWHNQKRKVSPRYLEKQGKSRKTSDDLTFGYNMSVMSSVIWI